MSTPIDFVKTNYDLIICTQRHGLWVIKLELILKLKIKRNDWLLADMSPQAANHCALFKRTRVRKQSIIALYFEVEIELKFYNLKARFIMTHYYQIDECKLQIL